MDGYLRFIVFSFEGQMLPEALKVPRPANAFMLFANENRKKMAQQFPLESNKEISKRLGNSWKQLEAEEKNRFFVLAKKVDAEHKLKYPGSLPLFPLLSLLFHLFPKVYEAHPRVFLLGTFVRFFYPVSPLLLEESLSVLSFLDFYMIF